MGGGCGGEDGEEQGKAARDGAGWHACLDALEAALGGQADSRSHLDRGGQLYPHYTESFGPEAATSAHPDIG